MTRLAIILLFLIALAFVEPVAHGLAACHTGENPGCPVGGGE